MRYFVFLDRVFRGPLTAEEVRALPGFSGATPVCREDRDRAISGHWTAAAYCRGLLGPSGRRLPAADGGVARYWSCATAQALVQDALAAARRRPSPKSKRPARPLLRPLAGLFLILAAAGASTMSTSRPAPPPRQPLPVDGGLAARVIPSCMPEEAARELRERIRVVRAGRRLEVTIPADGSRLKEDAVFDVDPDRQELRPLSEAARRLLDVRRGCGQP